MKDLRADRLATLYLFRPFKRWIPDRGVTIPILMYHSISDSKENRHPYYRTCTAPMVFREQLKTLRDSGYESIGLGEAISMLSKKGAESKKRVVITFDDGYEDFYSQAFPLLAEYRYSATVFLPTAYIGEDRLRFNNYECLTWSQITELQRAGIEFGSHTVTHPQLTSLSLDDVREELSRSRSIIEHRIGKAVTSFAYPYAFPETHRVFVGELRSILRDSGYECGVSTVIGTAGTNSDRYFLERLPVNSCDDSELFLAKLQGGYDWLHSAQYLSKLSLRRS